MSELAEMLTRRSIHQALKSWHQSSQLGEHPLAQLRIVEQRRKALNYDASPTGYGMALRDVLRWALEQVRPDDGTPTPLDKRWRGYVILTERYIRQASPDAIAEEMGLARSTYDHAQNAAIEALASILREREEGSKGVEEAGPAPFLAPPRSAHALIGRDELIAALKRGLIEGSGRIALCGLPGVGKTALALHLASEPDIAQDFADGVLWAGLGRSPNVLALLGTWGIAFGLSSDDLSRLPRLEERARTLRALIARRRMLLIIDDAWRIDDALAFLVGGPECVYLLTTRQPHVALDFAGDAAIQVSELDSASGTALIEMFAPGLGTEQPDAVRGLVESVGGLPLALTLMGQYLRKESRAGHPRRLRAAIERLQSTGARLRLEQPGISADQEPSFAPGTPLSLLNVIALSIEALEPPAQQALWALSIVPPKPNTISEDAALTIAQADYATLDALSDAGLLEASGTDRYALHPTIAEYARLQLAETPGTETEIQQRLARYFTSLLTNHAALDAETENIVTALEAAFSLQEWTALSDGANRFYSYLETRGLYALAQPHLQRAEEATRQIQFPAGRVSTLNSLGRMAQRYGDYQEAERLMQEGLALARSLPDDDLTSELLQGLGVVAVNRGEYEVAEGYFQEGLALAQMTERPARISALLANLGTLRFSRGDYAGAEKHFLDGLAIAREADLPGRISALLTNLGVLAARRGQYEVAEHYFRESLSLAEALGHRENVIFLLTNLGTLASERGHFEQAEAALQEALALARQIGQRARISHLMANLGMLATHSGQHVKAEETLQEGLALAREMGHRESIMLHLINLGALEIARGNLPLAEQYLGEALSSARAIGHRQYVSAALNHRGELHLQAGAPDQAAAAFREALDIARSVGVEAFAATALFGMARAAAAQGNLAEAASHLRESRGIFQAIGHYRSQEVAAWADENRLPLSSDAQPDA